MNFTLSTSGRSYPEDDCQELQALGFTFRKGSYIPNAVIIEGSPEVEIGSLEELIEFSNKWGTLIISEGSIEIYDDYRE